MLQITVYEIIFNLIYSFLNFQVLFLRKKYLNNLVLRIQRVFFRSLEQTLYIIISQYSIIVFFKTIKIKVIYFPNFKVDWTSSMNTFLKFNNYWLKEIKYTISLKLIYIFVRTFVLNKYN